MINLRGDEISMIRYLEENKGIKLTEQQLDVIYHIDGPSLTLAVPGAGKTTALVIRTGNLVFNHGVPSDRILTMTFSKAAARDMENRFNILFEDYLKDSPMKTHFSTIHSFAYSIVNRHFKYKEMIESSNATISKVNLIREIYRDITKGYLQEDECEEVVTAISYIKNKMYDINTLSSQHLKEICSIACFKSLYTKYEEHKVNNGLIDFDDMLTVCYEILKNNRKLLDLYRSKYDYIQLDEAQDTSNIQFAIVNLLAKPKNNIFYLADDDQSLYSYRGSEVSTLLNFKRDYPNGKMYFMEQNFRSTKGIIDISNDFIKANKKRYNKNMFTDKPVDRPITIVSKRNEKEELKYIIEKIKDTTRYSDNAILYRNNILNVAIVNELYKNDIPFYIREQNNRFFSHWIIQDILAYINLALNENDFKSFERIYYKGNLYINKSIILNSQRLNNGIGCLGAILKVEGLSSNQRNAVIEMKAKLRKLRTSSENEIITVILNDLGYKDFLKKRAKEQGSGLENLYNIITVFKLITEDCKNLINVIEKMEELQNLLKNSYHNRNKNAVTLTTIHGSKGLEWNNVYVISMVENIFPTKQSIIKLDNGDISLLEEERRLCYVAMTRGKQYVDLITLETKNGEYVDSSLFIKELIGLKVKNNNISIDSKLEVDTRTSSERKVFRVGDCVVHKKFGRGKITSVDIPSDIIMVFFNDNNMKKLSYNYCKKGILSKE